MALTKEQELIINSISVNVSMNKKFGIIATAGSGKTFTLSQLAKTMSNRKILYLVFNKTAQLDAQKKFGSNVEVRTLHSLAYQNVKPSNLTSSYHYYDFKGLTKNKGNIQDSIRKLSYVINNPQISWDSLDDLTKECWSLVLNNKVPFTHSAYVRAFIDSQELLDQAIKPYEIIFIDEAQDLNPLTFSMLSKINKPQVYVGDPNQAIYGFLDCVNIFDKVKFDMLFNLSQTFRCNTEITKQANLLLHEIDRKDTVEMTSQIGVNNQKIEQLAFLTRTNNQIIKFLLACHKENRAIPKLYKSADELFADIFLYYDFVKVLYKNQKIINEKLETINQERIAKSALPLDIALILENRDSFLSYVDEKELNKFSTKDKANKWLEFFYTYSEFNRYIKCEATLQISQSASSMLETIRQLDEKECRNLHKLIKNNQIAINGQETIMTAHASKGLEFDMVCLCSDFPSISAIEKQVQEAKSNPDQNKFQEAKQYRIDELSLFYVALTRAKYCLKDFSGNVLFLEDKYSKH